MRGRRLGDRAPLSGRHGRGADQSVRPDRPVFRGAVPGGRGPLDDNPANVMRAADGRLVVADLFYADGPNLYAAAATDPDLVVARIPEGERRFMTEIPLACSGPWEPEVRDAMRAGLAAADARNNST